MIGKGRDRCNFGTTSAAAAFKASLSNEGLLILAALATVYIGSSPEGEGAKVWHTIGTQKWGEPLR